MRRLRSDWGQARRSILRTGRKSAKLCVQPKSRGYFTYSLFTALSPPKKDSFQNTVLSERNRQHSPSPPQTETDTRYIQGDYLQYSQMIENSSFKNKTDTFFLCFSLLLHIIMSKNEKEWGTFVAQDEWFPEPSVWQLVGGEQQTITRL